MPLDFHRSNKIFSKIGVRYRAQVDFYYQRTLIIKALKNEKIVLATAHSKSEPSPENSINCQFNELEFDRLALVNFDRYIDARPQDPDGYCYRGMYSVYDNRGEIKRLSSELQPARADYERASDLNPQFVAAYFHRGIVRMELGNVDAALADFDRAISIDPKYIDAYPRRSWIYFRRDELTISRSSIHPTDC